jgi:hypothetical protein
MKIRLAVLEFLHNDRQNIAKFLGAVFKRLVANAPKNAPVICCTLGLMLTLISVGYVNYASGLEDIYSNEMIDFQSYITVFRGSLRHLRIVVY